MKKEAKDCLAKPLTCYKEGFLYYKLSLVSLFSWSTCDVNFWVKKSYGSKNKKNIDFSATAKASNFPQNLVGYTTASNKQAYCRVSCDMSLFSIGGIRSSTGPMLTQKVIIFVDFDETWKQLVNKSINWLPCLRSYLFTTISSGVRSE